MGKAALVNPVECAANKGRRMLSFVLGPSRPEFIKEALVCSCDKCKGLRTLMPEVRGASWAERWSHCLWVLSALLYIHT